jgi:tyrosyl-tRNA synthetase
MEKPERQLDILTAGTIDFYNRDELLVKLQSFRPLKVKVGFDPTRPDLHLGHTILLRKMQDFIDCGHEVIFVIGDFTAMIGDPTGRNEQRPRLSYDEVMAAAETYQEQAFKILDRSKTTVRYNSEWLGKLTPSDIIELTSRYSVARMLERDEFNKRFKGGQPIFIHEFLYPLLQAYDSVILKADIELGGTDQLFNLMVGRDLMTRYNLPAQMVATVPIIEGLDAQMIDGEIVGPKMSKSANNYVGIAEPALVMVQKLMSLNDNVIFHFMKFFSSASLEKINALEEAVKSGSENILEIKEKFVREVVCCFHDSETVNEVFEIRKKISQGEVPSEVISEVIISSNDDTIWLAKALLLANLVKSSSDGKRLIENGGIHVNGTKLEKADSQFLLKKNEKYLIRAGSKNKRFVNIWVQ